MHNRFLIICVISFLISLGPYLLGNNQPLADSLRFIVNNHLYNSDTEKYDFLCQIAENSIDADTVIFYSERAIKLANKLNISSARPLLQNGLGYLYAGNHALALEKFLQAAKLYKQDGNNIGMAATYDYISNTYISQHNHKNAILYLKKAINIFNRENDSYRLATVQHNLGYAYYKVKQYDSALILFSQSKKIYQDMQYEEGYAYCLGNSGLVYSRLDELEKAENQLLNAIEILNKYRDDFAITDFMIEYANILQQKGEINSAINYASKSYTIAHRNNIYEQKSEAAYRLSKLYGAIKRYDSAYYYQSIYIQCNDSIKNYETIQKMADLRTEYEVAQKQAEVDILQKEKTIQLIVIGALILSILLAGGLIFLYYSSLKRTKKFTVILDERRKLLEQQRTELRDINNIKDKFFSIISHDLRGPISSLGGISIMIKESMELDNQAFLEDIADYIDEAVISLSGLLENLLNWALSQQGKLPFTVSQIDTKELVSDVVRLFSTFSLLKNIRIKLALKEGLAISGDKNSLMMIIRNLLSNALKFTNKEGTVSISTGLADKNMVKISITDTGIGISPEKIPLLFELIEDKSTRGTEKEKGVGLGLNLVHEFVKLNKGDIKVQSTMGSGTTFTLFFPAADQS